MKNFNFKYIEKNDKKFKLKTKKNKLKENKNRENKIIKKNKIN